MNFYERLECIMRELSWTQSDFADNCKLTSKTVSTWKKNPSKVPAMDSLKKISKGTGRTVRWLQTGEGEEFVDAEKREPSVNVSGGSSYESAGGDIVKIGGDVYELDDDEKEFFRLHKKYGNKATLEKCSKIVKDVADFIKKQVY